MNEMALFGLVILLLISESFNRKIIEIRANKIKINQIIIKIKLNNPSNIIETKKNIKLKTIRGPII